MSGSTGSLLGGAASLITSVASLFGTSGSSNTTSNSNATQSSNQTAKSTTNATQSSSGLQSITNIIDTLTNSKTVNSADPEVIATLKGLVNSALGNSTGGGASSVVSGIFQQAKDSFASVFGQQGASGLYNSSTAGVLASDAQARATADAASAVLGYQTQEQGIANSGLQELLQATATSSTAGSSTTNQQQSTSQTNKTSATSTTDQANESNTAAHQAGTSSTDQSSGFGSVICTWMTRNGYLDHKRHRYVSVHFLKTYSKYAIAAYRDMAAPCVKELERDINSRLSKTIMWMIWNRTEYVCAEMGMIGPQKTLKGLLCKKLVYCCCLPRGLYILAKDIPHIVANTYCGFGLHY